MNLPFPITLSEKDLKYGNEYEKDKAFGGYILKKEGLMCWVSGWPDVIDEYYVTEYRFTSSEYKVFEFAVGDAIDTVSSILDGLGYKINESDNHYTIYSKDNKVNIRLYYDENKAIYEIWVTAVATNKQNVVF